MVFYEMGAGWLLLSLLMPFWIIITDRPQWIPSLSDWGWIWVLVLFCTVWAQALALSALKTISSFTASLSVNLEPIYGILLAFVFFQENQDLHGRFYLGMLLILLSVFWHMGSALKGAAQQRK